MIAVRSESITYHSHKVYINGFTSLSPHASEKETRAERQIVLPKEIREMLGVKPGNEIILEVTGDEVKIRPSNKPETYFDRFGNTSRKLTKIVDIKKNYNGKSPLPDKNRQ